MRRMLMVLAAAVSMVLLVCGVAAASITLFEAPLFHLGSVNGQSGVGGFPWKSAPPGAIPSCNPTPTLGQYDQEVVANMALLLASLLGSAVSRCVCRTSCGNGEFFYQTYSAQEPLQVGEARPNKVFLAEFAFHPQDARLPARTVLERQPGLRRGLAHVLGGPGRYAGRYPGHRLRYP